MKKVFSGKIYSSIGNGNWAHEIPAYTGSLQPLLIHVEIQLTVRHFCLLFDDKIKCGHFASDKEISQQNRHFKSLNRKFEIQDHAIVNTLRNFKFSSNKICWSTGIKFTVVELFNKIWRMILLRCSWCRCSNKFC